MPRTRLTDLLIKTARPRGAEAQTDFRDTTVTGLSLRMTRMGTKAFSFKFRAPDGKERRIKLGRYPELMLSEARVAAMDLKSRWLRGEIPVEQKESGKEESDLNVSHLVGEFVKRHARYNRSGHETERILRREFESMFGEREYSSISKGEIIRVIETIADRGAPVQARNMLAALRKMFNWAVSRDLLEYSPCDRVKPPGKAPKRERVLTLAEIQSIWNATGVVNWPFREITRLLILTGQRRMEIGNLR